MLYIMRHGKTEWNVLNKLQGRTDIPLNDEGKAMAIKAAKEYKDVNIDICFCSPLLRAKETAQLVLENRNVPIIPDNRLIEMCFGEYEGVKNLFPVFNSKNDIPISAIFIQPEKYTHSVCNAETFEELFARTGEFLKEKVQPLLAEGKDVLIVGHAAMNSSIICQIKNIPIKDFWSTGTEQCKMMKLI